MEMKVTTVKSRQEYRATVNDVRVTFARGDNDGMVWLYTPTSMLGGYRLERFGEELTTASVRQFITDNVKAS